MIAGEANASVELTPNMAGPAFDALEKYKKDGTLPEKLTITKIDAVSAGYGERRVREEEKYGLLSGEPLIPSLSPVGEGKKQRSRNPGKPSATRGNLTSFEGDIDYERRGTPGDPSHRRT